MLGRGAVGVRALTVMTENGWQAVSSTPGRISRMWWQLFRVDALLAQLLDPVAHHSRRAAVEDPARVDDRPRAAVEVLAVEHALGGVVRARDDPISLMFAGSRTSKNWMQPSPRARATHSGAAA